jgi:hypothetical protein
MSEPWWWQMKLRPHHLLDIITQYGQGRPFEPSDYGHAVHTVARLVLADQTQQAEMVVGADDICAPCRNLLEGRCTDVVSSLDPPVSKAGQVLTIRAFADRTLDRLQDLEQVCSHPGEEPAARLRDLRQGLQRMGLCLSR